MDYTVDNKRGELISGNITHPMKLTEEWTSTRPMETNDWKFEKIKIMSC